MLLISFMLGHANANVLNGDHEVGLFRNGFDKAIGLRFNIVWVCGDIIAIITKSIVCIGDQFSQEHLFVGIDGGDA
eukprot:CAMPEP_0172891646 /NCGR_PEP_ID=MMETSP1075-20121228/144322_1 /TAXON_ID=2916 /ORGANISM="Ceratium fusus, Strain PA161109" /LENGTH=75 /DNA_ID=CAMNT_0013746143 /DNA_START=29 /DNA_END=252 /DNA_ORIENTATION=+